MNFGKRDNKEAVRLAFEKGKEEVRTYFLNQLQEDRERANGIKKEALLELEKKFENILSEKNERIKELESQRKLLIKAWKMVEEFSIKLRFKASFINDFTKLERDEVLKKAQRTDSFIDSLDILNLKICKDKEKFDKLINYDGDTLSD